MTPGDLTAIAFYDKPLLKFERLLESYLAVEVVRIPRAHRGRTPPERWYHLPGR